MADEAHRLTEAELEQIEQRCGAASKPPWQSFIEGRDHWGEDNFIRVGGMDDSEPDIYVSRSTPEGLVPASDADLDFIAHAPRPPAPARGTGPAPRNAVLTCG